MRMPALVRSDLGNKLSAVKRAVNEAQEILNAPEGKQLETLEDAFNAVQEAGYEARREFGRRRDEVSP